MKKTVNIQPLTHKVLATKFVRYEIPELKSLQDSIVYKLREKLNNGQRMNRTEKNWLAKKIKESTHFKKAVPLMGYLFSFADVLKTFVVKQYGNWSEYHAPDKTSLRASIFGKIDRIVEIGN